MKGMYIMIRKQIYLEENMNRKINEIAVSKGIPQSEVIREGLELYLQSHEEKAKDWNELFTKMKASDIKIREWNREDLYSNRIEGKPANHERD